MASPLQIALATNDKQLVTKISEGLAQNDMTVCVVADEQEAHKLAKGGDVQLFMVDTRLGSDVTRGICAAIRKNETSPVGIIAVIEGYSETLDDLMAATVDDILVYPFTVFSLIARVNAQLQRITTAEQLAFKVRDSWTLIDITSKLVGTGDLLYSLFDMVSILSGELDADRSSVVLVRSEGDLGLVIASSDNRDIQDLVINLDAYPEIKTVARTRKPLIVTDVNDSKVLESVLPTLQSVRVESIALFPIIEEDNVLGVIFLRFTHQRNSFHQRELVFCQTVANATAIALRNHEITESLREKDEQIEQVQSEAEHRLAALQPYEDFFMRSMDGLVVLSDTGVVVFINPEGAGLFGLRPGEIKGIPFTSLLPENQMDRLEALIERNEKGHRISVDLEIIQVEGDEGNEKTLATTAALLGNEGMTLLTLRDVTEERRTARRLIEAQEQLIKSEKQTAIMEVAGAAAHELNQPLTSILTSLAMFRRLADEKKDPPPRLMETMEQEIDRMTAIIRRLSKLTDYTTKAYVGESKILDLERSSEDTGEVETDE